MKEPNTRTITVRMPEKLFCAIEEIARIERRSLANVAILLLEQALEERRA